VVFWEFRALEEVVAVVVVVHSIATLGKTSHVDF
jgi:hypothetical protein